MDWLYKGSRTKRADEIANTHPRLAWELRIENLWFAVHDAALASILRDHAAMNLLREDVKEGLAPELTYIIEDDESEWKYDVDPVDWSIIAGLADDPADAILDGKEN